MKPLKKMRIFIALAMMMAVSVPVALVRADAPTSALTSVPHDVSAEQRQLAERIASRLDRLLEGEPYVIEQTCSTSDDCTISIYR